jgi:hypothetical protein
MIFTLLLGFSALFVAGCAAYFSVLGIATLFSGSFLQVAIMASSLELGKLVATSYLYRFWSKTTFLLKCYLMTAVVVLMGVTSLGIFGYLSAAYQVNSSKFAQVDARVEMVQQQKQLLEQEIAQNSARIDTLNEARLSQEKRLPTMSREAAKPVYTDMERAAEEIKRLTERSQELRTAQFEKDNEIIALSNEIHGVKDIGTFKFVADVIGRPLDTVVIAFISVLICVFDPLAVSLILAFNIASTGRMVKEQKTVAPATKSPGFATSGHVENKNK